MHHTQTRFIVYPMVFALVEYPAIVVVGARDVLLHGEAASRAGNQGDVGRTAAEQRRADRA
jgi:hypothetical protein